MSRHTRLLGDGEHTQGRRAYRDTQTGETIELEGNERNDQRVLGDLAAGRRPEGYEQNYHSGAYQPRSERRRGGL